MTDLIERELELPWRPDEVWRALTDPAWLRSWLADEVALELWPGGEARFTVDAEIRSGWVEEVSAPTSGEDANPPHPSGRLVFWWQPEGEPASRVALELEATEEGSRLHVVEARPLEVLDLVGIPLPGRGWAGGQSFGPALIAA
jgi:uncharacterized protein YndB with AHSA1/START domain